MKLITMLLMLLPIIGISQVDTLPMNKETGKYELSEVVNVDSMSAEKLYSNSKIFVAKAFKSGEDVTQLNDDRSKTVIGKSLMRVMVKVGIGKPVPTYIRFTFTVESKENKYRYSITDFLFYDTVEGTSTKAFEDVKYWNRNGASRKALVSVKQQVSTDLSGLIADLKKQMIAAKDW